MNTNEKNNAMTQDSVVVAEDQLTDAQVAMEAAPESAEAVSSGRGGRVAAAVAAAALLGAGAAGAAVLATDSDDEALLDDALNADDNDVEIDQPDIIVDERHDDGLESGRSDDSGRATSAHHGVNHDAPAPHVAPHAPTAPHATPHETPHDTHVTPHTPHTPVNTTDPIDESALTAQEIDRNDNIGGDDVLEQLGLVPVEVGTTDDGTGSEITYCRLVDPAGEEYVMLDRDGNGVFDVIYAPDNTFTRLVGDETGADTGWYNVSDMQQRIEDGGLSGSGYLNPVVPVQGDDLRGDVIDPNDPNYVYVQHDHHTASHTTVDISDDDDYSVASVGSDDDFGPDDFGVSSYVDTDEMMAMTDDNYDTDFYADDDFDSIDDFDSTDDFASMDDFNSHNDIDDFDTSDYAPDDDGVA